MKLHQLFLTENNCYKTGRKHVIKGVMVHSTGANNPDLKRYVGPDDGILGHNRYGNHWNQPKPGGRSVCVHAFIGKDKYGTVRTYQTLPWNHVGWHSGYGSRGSANTMGYVGFEVCEDNLQDRNYFNKVYTEAVELTAHILKIAGLPCNESTVIDHAEGHKMGIASNHADISHWLRRYNKSMDVFRTDVNKLMGNIGGATIVVLRRGNKGTAVTKLQKDLLSLGYSFGKYGADGSYGAVTEATVKQFQRDNKLVVDGIAGPATQAKIKELKAKSSTNVYYRVRKTWADSQTQKGAFTNLQNAIDVANKNPGYFVFDENGKKVSHNNNSDLLKRIAELEAKLEAIKKIIE